MADAAIPDRSYDGITNEIFLQRTNHSNPSEFFFSRVLFHCEYFFVLQKIAA
jgi:hypothetical protein